MELDTAVGPLEAPMNYMATLVGLVCTWCLAGCGGHFDSELRTHDERWASLEAAIAAGEDIDDALLWMIREEPNHGTRAKAIELLPTVATKLDRHQVLEWVFRFDPDSGAKQAARRVFEHAWPREEMVARHYGLLMRCAAGLGAERWTACFSLSTDLRYPRAMVEHILAEPEPIDTVRTLFLIHLIDTAVREDRSLADDMRVIAWLDQREQLRHPACDRGPLSRIRDYWKARAAQTEGHR